MNIKAETRLARYEVGSGDMRTIFVAERDVWLGRTADGEWRIFGRIVNTSQVTDVNLAEVLLEEALATDTLGDRAQAANAMAAFADHIGRAVADHIEQLAPSETGKVKLERAIGCVLKSLGTPVATMRTANSCEFMLLHAPLERAHLAVCDSTRRLALDALNTVLENVVATIDPTVAIGIDFTSLRIVLSWLDAAEPTSDLRRHHTDKTEVDLHLIPCGDARWRIRASVGDLPNQLDLDELLLYITAANYSPFHKAQTTAAIQGSIDQVAMQIVDAMRTALPTMPPKKLVYHTVRTLLRSANCGFTMAFCEQSMQFNLRNPLLHRATAEQGLVLTALEKWAFTLLMKLTVRRIKPTYIVETLDTKIKISMPD